MEHRGVEYLIIQGIQRGFWKWSVETETGTKSGTSDSRDAAMAAASQSPPKAEEAAYLSRNKTTQILDVRIRRMDQILPPKLTDLELEALRQIAVHPATRHIPYRVQSRLKDIGYAKEVLGGIVLTDDGLQRIAIDRERVRTFVEADAPR